MKHLARVVFLLLLGCTYFGCASKSGKKSDDIGEDCIDAKCGEPCVSVNCDDPPQNHCVAKSKLREYDRVGTCEDGDCFYGYEDHNCAQACEEGQCVGDPCVGVVCDAPAMCETATGATCVDGTCNYPADIGAACDDVTPCTYSDQCRDDKSCQGTSYKCENPAECETSVGALCNGDGTCSYQADTAAVCDDGDSCTNNDRCYGDKECRGTEIPGCREGTPQSDGGTPWPCDPESDSDCLAAVVPRNIAAGSDHTCVLMDSGDVRCWGSNRLGQLGYGTCEDTPDSCYIGDNEAPVSAGNVDLGGKVVHIAAYGIQSCAILDTGDVRCWGNFRRDYGLDVSVGWSETPASAPDALINIGGRAVQLAVGADHSCALMNTGKVRCWGGNMYEQLGYENAFADETPAQKGDLSIDGRVVQITAGQHHTCVLLDTGRVRCWGDNSKGQLGFPTAGEVSGLLENNGDLDIGQSVVQIDAGYQSTCAILDSGEVRCWGQAPIGSSNIDLGGTAVQISVGFQHACALLNTGKVRCWGINNYGQLGYGNSGRCPSDMTNGGKDYCSIHKSCCIGDDETPAEAGDVPVGGHVVEIVAGNYHTCALLDSGDVRCWGSNENAQTGFQLKYSSCIDQSYKSGFFDCRQASNCCIGDRETPASKGNVPFR